MLNVFKYTTNQIFHRQRLCFFVLKNKSLVFLFSTLNSILMTISFNCLRKKLQNLDLFTDINTYLSNSKIRD